MSALVRPGGEIGLARNCHKASYHACYLGDLVIHSLYPQWEPKFGINGGILPEDVEKASEGLSENSGGAHHFAYL